MAIFKCKMCGGTLEIVNGETVAVCEYCGTKQTIPRLDDEKRIQLYDRANHFRRENEFDKAMGVYEMVLGEDSEDSEAYWGIVLCKYGIEYVEDPRSHKRIPTINRAQFTSIFDDINYLSAIKYADSLQKEVYEAEAKQIDIIQKGILEISSKEEPFDIFICYKETDNLGNRTEDSVYAQDIYNALKKEGYKVFFSRITLENKLGMAYEPYIFAALHSAKVMLTVGTTKENFNAVWVKNEWSRFLSLMKEDNSKVLIPCYKGISPYEMPEEFTYFQSQDIGKIGYIQDIIHGVSKIIGKGAKTVVVNTASVASIDPLIKRAFMFLEDSKWAEASEYCERVLDQDPEYAMAYLGKLMANKKVPKKEELLNQENVFDKEDEYFKILRFGDKALIDELNGYNDQIAKRNEEKRKKDIYAFALSTMQNAKTENAYKTAYNSFCNVKGYKDSDILAEECLKKAEYCRQDVIYRQAVADFNKADVDFDNESNIPTFERCLQSFKSISGFKDSDRYIIDCQNQIETIKAKEEFYRIERERKAKEKIIEKEKARKKINKVIAIVTSIVAVCIVFAIIFNTVIIPNQKYNKAKELVDAGYDVEAYYIFKELNYKDSRKQAENIIKNYIIEFNSNQTIKAFCNNTIGLKSDGTVVAVGDNKFGQCNVSDWTDVVAISAGNRHTVGLKLDGTVVAVGDNEFGQCNISDWKDIIAISAGAYYTVGLKSDGTVVAVGNNGSGQCDVSAWTDIVAISAGGIHTVGLKLDGTVVAVGMNSYGQCNVSDWTDIVAISVGGIHTVGLKSDGTVVAVGNNGAGQCNVSDWTDIVAVSAGSNHTVGLKSDGTVVAVGYNNDGQCEVYAWTDIVAISAGSSHTVGLKSDGTVVAVGNNEFGQCDTKNWENIKIPTN